MNKQRLQTLAGLLSELKKPLNEETETSGFEKAKQSVSDIESMQKQINKLQNSLKSVFQSESTKYMSGKWDIINVKYAGSKRWGGQRKNMSNDISNYYNAKIKEIRIDDFKYDAKTGKIIPLVYINAQADNVRGDAYMPLKDLSIVPAYTSAEGKEFKKGY